jgi:hypothetical protein
MLTVGIHEMLCRQRRHRDCVGSQPTQYLSCQYSPMCVLADMRTNLMYMSSAGTWHIGWRLTYHDIAA